MLRNPLSTRIAHGPPRLLASPGVLCTATKPTKPLPTASRAFHTSPSSHETARKQKSRLKKSKHQTARAESARVVQENRPHPALGYAPGKESVWMESKLCKLLITEEQVRLLPVPTATLQMEPERVKVRGPDGKYKFDFKSDKFETELSGRMVPKIIDGRPSIISFDTPKLLNYGVGQRERRLIFEDLPYMRWSADVIKQDEIEARKEVYQHLEIDPKQWSSLDEDLPQPRQSLANGVDHSGQERGLQYWFGRLLDIKNASASGLEFENKKRIVAAFSLQGKAHNPGLPEVQAALKTYRIHVLWNHLKAKKNDIHNRRQLLLMIHQRAKILHYLRGTYRARYEALLPALGLERGAVEGQLQLHRDLTPV